MLSRGLWILTVLAALVMCVHAPTVGAQSAKVDVTGTWAFTELTGSIKGQTIEFTVRADIQGMPLEFKFNGTVEGKDSMKGALSTGGFGDATFTGKRK